VTNNAVAVAAIVMSGLFLTVVVWQLLSVARTAVAHNKSESNRQLQERLSKLEELHEEIPHPIQGRSSDSEGIPGQATVE
jgi:hypothetical protein